MNEWMNSEFNEWIERQHARRRSWSTCQAGEQGCQGWFNEIVRLARPTRCQSHRISVRRRAIINSREFRLITRIKRAFITTRRRKRSNNRRWLLVDTVRRRIFMTPIKIIKICRLNSIFSVFAFRTARRRKLHAGGTVASSFMVLWSRKWSKSLHGPKNVLSSRHMGPVCLCASLETSRQSICFMQISLCLFVSRRVYPSNAKTIERYSRKLFSILLNAMFLVYWDIEFGSFVYVVARGIASGFHYVCSSDLHW